MPSKVAEALGGLKNRITNLLKVDPTPPKTYLELGSWMAKHLTQEEFNQLDLLEVSAGEKEANDWLVQSMVDSGKYQCDEKGFVWVKEESK